MPRRIHRPPQRARKPHDLVKPQFRPIIKYKLQLANPRSGYCSREQIYRPENCGICHAILIGKAGSGFWEGGKGTRNRVLMSRKGMHEWHPFNYLHPGFSLTGVQLNRSAEI